MVTTAPHPDPRPDQEDQPDQQETARAPKRGDWSTWRGESVAIIVLSTLAHAPGCPRRVARRTDGALHPLLRSGFPH